MQIIADLHTHTLSATHAFNTLDEMAAKAAALGYAALAQGLGMVAGEPGGYFQPLANATRAQAATMLYNLMAH